MWSYYAQNIIVYPAIGSIGAGSLPVSDPNACTDVGC